jgi:hypothetical protein
MLDLNKYKQAIIDHKPLQKNLVTYNKNRWTPAFKEAHHLTDLQALHDKGISRNTIIKVFKDYYSGKIKKPFTPFLVTMIWGYDSSGFGPFRVSRFITPGNELLIKNVLAAVADHDIKKAFTLLMKIKGLGISFVSKVLYFAARAVGIKNYPLIFDIRVANNLVRLSTGGKLDGMVSVQPAKNFKGYDAYNSMIHAMANKLDVDAEEVEYFIFKYEGKKNRF